MVAATVAVDLGKRLHAAVERAVLGRARETEAAVSAFLAGGHVLLEGPPGTGKTLLVRALAACTGCSFRRIQFTPDLMPSDVLGTNVYDARDATFRLVRGPVFAQIVMADEINRAPAKTQAALLECMEERRVTLDGTTHTLPAGFSVFATMNPIELEGTFPLPEAQVDRFLMKIRLGELGEEAERAVLARAAGGFDAWSFVDAGAIEPVTTPEEIQAARAEVRRIAVDAAVYGYLLALVRRTRTHPAVTLGASTRAAVALLHAVQAHAACAGRAYVIPDDVKFLAPFVLAHRLAVSPDAELDGVDGERVIAQIVDATPAPRSAT